MRYRKGQSGNSFGGKSGVWDKILRAFVFVIERSGSCVYVQNWEKWQTEEKRTEKGIQGLISAGIILSSSVAQHRNECKIREKVILYFYLSIYIPSRPRSEGILEVSPQISFCIFCT
jgi:hypothetical protein